MVARLINVLLLSLLLLRGTGEAQPPCQVTHPAKGDTRVRCGDVEIGVRDNVDGTRDVLRKKRSLKSLGVKAWQVERRHRPHEFPAERDPLVRDPEALLAPLADVPPPTSAAVVDFSAVWSTAAAGGRSLAELTAWGCLIEATTNESLANSQVTSGRMRLVDAWVVPYVEATGTTADQADYGWWYRQTSGAPGDGQGPQFQRLESNGSDLSVFLTRTLISCGLASLRAGGKGTGQAWVNDTCAVGNLSAAHELGHLWALHHRRADGATNQYYADGYGWSDGLRRDVLAYAAGPRLRQYSNPHVPFLGTTSPSGTANDNNARVAELRLPTVAGFRPPRVAVGLCSTPRRPARPVGGRVVSTEGVI
jgi:hypothetical protein